MLFKDEYRFLSNMSPSIFTYQGVSYLSSEAMYQALKLEDPSLRKIFDGLTGKQSKKLGKSIPVRSDWEDVKIEVMVFVLVCKFLKDDLYEKLKSVNYYIEETNTWNDRFWGVCGGEGWNALGQILTIIRDDYSYSHWRTRNENVTNGKGLKDVKEMLRIIDNITKQIQTSPEDIDLHSSEMGDVVGYMGDHIY